MVSPSDTGPARSWPRVEATRLSDTTASVRIAGTEHTVSGPDPAGTRAAALARVAQTARLLGYPLRVTAHEPGHGDYEVIVHPDGEVEPVSQPARRRSARRRAAGERRRRVRQRVEGDGDAAGHGALDEGPPGSPPVSPTSVPQARPARRFWVSAARRRVDQELAAACVSIARPLDRARTVLIVNPWPGGHKTTAALMLASTIGLHRGGRTLAWDTSAGVGNLAWRTPIASWATTATDVLRVDLSELAGRQGLPGGGWMDVLCHPSSPYSPPDGAEGFAKRHAELAAHYDVMVLDSGAEPGAPAWSAAMDVADQVVVVCPVRAAMLEEARVLLERTLAGQEERIGRGVVVLSGGRPWDSQLRSALRDYLARRARAVLEVPCDRALAAGRPVRLRAVAGRTRTAWLRVAAAVAEGL